MEFLAAAHLDPKRQSIYSERRREGERYAVVKIIDCQHKDWWYSKFIGVECFVRLRFNNYGRGEFISEGVLVKVNKNRVLSGRSISVKDLMII
ncbi:MAG: hypothetical protein EKK63_01735 [Acinetobacter sp.]|uniref:hypothetical protein n=1 Tax=Acinetobacter sp. TaxID=472 RepID=UPI000FAC1404|nr:hypothetical protein [Acinetobacter sp.]RUP42326.1 MAG: hypothetical protein EKK63_01735 [Acinetobacter sp.]